MFIPMSILTFLVDYIAKEYINKICELPKFFFLISKVNNNQIKVKRMSLFTYSKKNI